MSLPILWFLIMGVLLAGYAILDGFDLGVGMLHLVAQSDTERRTILNSIGPIWDGNEVWLITFGGAMYLAAVCVLPTIITDEFGVTFYFGGTSLLIVVGVAMDTIQQVESQLIMRHYEGFSRRSRVRGRRS